MRSACISQESKLSDDQLQLKSFWGLYVVCGLACLLALLIYFVLVVRQYVKHYSREIEPSISGSRSSRLQTFLTFVDEKEDHVISRSKRRQLERTSNRSMAGEEGESVNGGSMGGRIDSYASNKLVAVANQV